MKNTTKIIISLCVALVIVATVLVVGLVKNSGMLEETTTKPAYSLQGTTAPSTLSVTESWVDLEQMASELATATDTTDPSDTTTDTTAVAPVVQTTIIYVYTEYVENVSSDLVTTISGVSSPSVRVKELAVSGE